MSRLHCRIYFHPTCFRCSTIESDRRNELRIDLMVEEQTDRIYEPRGLMLHGVVGQRRYLSSIFFLFLQRLVKILTFLINFM